MIRWLFLLPAGHVLSATNNPVGTASSHIGVIQPAQLWEGCVREAAVIPMGDPTVRLVITVLTPTGWTALDGIPPAFEYVFTANELRRVLRAYGNVVGEVLWRQGYDAGTFRIVARGAIADRLLGIHEWAWDRREGAYVACGSAFLAWPAPAELPDHIRTGAALWSLESCA